MCYYVCVIMHVKDPYLSVVRVGHCVPLAVFFLSLYDLHALNRDVNMIQTKKQTKPMEKLHVSNSTHCVTSTSTCDSSITIFMPVHTALVLLLMSLFLLL